MRLVAIPCLVVVGACASLYGVSDVPDPGDGGTTAETGPASDTGSQSDANGDASAGDASADGGTTGDASADGPPGDSGPTCVISGKTYANGAVDPGNPCLSCQAITSPATWSATTGSCGDTLGGTCSAGGCVVPPSCVPAGSGTTQCGASAESCCTSFEVMGGTYSRTYTNGGSGPTAEADTATVSGLRLDKYEVTVGRFRQFVTVWNNGVGWTPPAGSGRHTHLNGGKGLANAASAGAYEAGWLSSNDTLVAPTNANLTCGSPYNTWTDAVGSQENLPINCLSWWEAYAFCIWDGGFLPSEAEWEYAAAGGAALQQYPWGTTPPGNASKYAVYDCYYGSSGSGGCLGATNIAPVGTTTLGLGVWGQLDLAGNLAETNLDWYSSPYVNPCADCAYLNPTTERVQRGGFYGSQATEILPPDRSSEGPTQRDYNLGLRCARTP